MSTTISFKVRLNSSLTFTVLFCYALFFISNNSIANDHVSQINVVTEYFEPYQIKHQDGQLGGFATEVVNTVLKEANVKADIVVMPWARAYEMASNTPNTLIYSMAHTEKRQNEFIWIGSLTNEHLYFWGLKENQKLPATSGSSLTHYRVAATRKSNAAQYLREHDFTKIFLLNNEDQNIQMLFKQRVDLIIATELTVKSRAKKLGLNNNELVKLQEIKALNNDLCIAFSKATSQDVIKHFRQAFKRVKQSGKLALLQQKWLTI